MDDAGQKISPWPQVAAVFGASGGIGSAITRELLRRGTQTVYAGTRKGDVLQHERVVPFSFDLEDARSIEQACQSMRALPPQLVVVATGVLTLEDGTGPEKSYRQIDEEGLARAFALNTIGPALIAKQLLPLRPREGRSVFAALSARVGSISDNRLGGWHSYRASKAALNMLIRNFAIEIERTHKEAIIVGLHPGTVDTALSEPFQSNLPEGQLTAPEDAAKNLLAVIEGLEISQSGKVFDWKGAEIPA